MKIWRRIIIFIAIFQKEITFKKKIYFDILPIILIIIIFIRFIYEEKENIQKKNKSIL